MSTVHVELEIYGFHLSCYYIWLRNQRIVWLCVWWLLIISHHLVKFGNYKSCGNRDVTFFIHHVIIVLCDHCGWRPLIRHDPVKFNGHRPHGSRNIMLFVCPVTSVTMWLKGMLLCRFWFLVISHHPVKFGGQESRKSGDIAFFICLVTLYDCLINGLFHG